MERSALAVIIYMVRLAFIHIKQFIVDYITFLVRKQNFESTRKSLDVIDQDLLAKGNESARDGTRGAKSWAGFDLKSKKEKVPTTKKNKKFRSAPARAVFGNRLLFAVDRVVEAKKLDKLKRQHRRLIKKFREARDRNRKKEITIEKIVLGDATPILNGIKYVDESNDHLGETDRFYSHLVPSDNNNMRFLCELSYESDKDFCIRVNSVPILEQVELRKIFLQLRLLITINHTTTELNRDLKILESPDDILFPAVNHIQLMLIDVPRIDWSLQKPLSIEAKKIKPVKGKRLIRTNATDMSQTFVDTLTHYLDPIRLINHSYFKYLTHSILYLCLKWFQPFDIKIGPHFYIKTTC